MARKVNIIGAGVAGLSAGCYLQMNGYETEIFELHNVPGGVCTAWKRKDYTIDNCIHWLVGSSPADNFYFLWNELVDMKSVKFVDHEEFMRVEDKDGNCIRVFSDVDRLEEELLAKAPDDRKLIREFTGAVRKFRGLRMPVDKAAETYGPIDGLKFMLTYLPYMLALRKWTRVSLQEYADRCRNPLLKKTFEYMFLPETIVFFMILTLAWMHNKTAGYPIGGSLEFARSIERRYLELGGKINYKSRVAKIATENDSARGIVLENGEVHNSDIVISAADGHCTIFEMLEGKYVDGKIRDYYDNREIFPSYLLVSLGVSRTFENEPHTLFLPAVKPLTIDESATWDDIMVRIFNFDPTSAPEGKTVISTMLTTGNYEYWDGLRKGNLDEYRRQKDRIADEVIEALDRRYPGLRSQVEMIDVSTPATVLRFTNNWRGSFEGWLWTTRVGLSGMKKTLPGLNDFYMAGHWVEPGGGVPPALKSGRDVAQIVCKKDKKRFTTTSF